MPGLWSGSASGGGAPATTSLVAHTGSDPTISTPDTTNIRLHNVGVDRCVHPSHRTTNYITTRDNIPAQEKMELEYAQYRTQVKAQQQENSLLELERDLGLLQKQ